jgi:hypothetical protein
MPILNFFQNQRNSFFGCQQTFELCYVRSSGEFQIAVDDIDALQSKRGCGSEEVAVIRIDFLETMFRRASQVKSIGGTEEC